MENQAETSSIPSFSPLLDDIRVMLNVPEVVLFARSYRLAPNPLGPSSSNSIARSHASRVSLHGVIDKHCVIQQDQVPDRQSIKQNSAICLEDLAPKRTLPK